jgi:hypothetical protein
MGHKSLLLALKVICAAKTLETELCSPCLQHQVKFKVKGSACCTLSSINPIKLNI